MDEWLVGLDGDSYSLACLARTFRSPELTVVEDKGSFYLKSSNFAALPDVESVRQRAAELVGVANGLVRLERPDTFRPVGLSGIIVSGSALTISAPIANVIGDALAPTVIGGGTIVSAPRDSTSPDSIHGLGVSLKDDPAVRDALGFFAYRDGWATNLYKVLERIRADVGKKRTLEGMGWAPRSEITRFTQTVNTLKEHRHAASSGLPPRTPMTEPEAVALVGALLTCWLRWKQPLKS
jgi:hypothetical protein